MSPSKDPSDKTNPTHSLHPSLLLATSPSVLPKYFPPVHHPVTYSIPTDTPVKYYVLSTSSTYTDFTNPESYPSQAPRFSTGTPMCFTEFIQRTNPTEVPSTPPSSPPPPDLRNVSLLVPLFLPIHLPIPNPTSEPFPPPFYSSNTHPPPPMKARLI